ncbi:MAG: TIR domain-containing protein [Ignavibacteriae bacterium]|nr:TIR domain-containing protein [Ignavibacteriota bacterium]
MARKVFFSFHYKPDNWRTSQVRNIGAIEGNKPASDNKWEEVTDGGDEAIQKWIDDNMYGRKCTIVLIGENTAGRKWINYEIKKAWKDGKGVLGIHIHNLKNSLGEQAKKGNNPFIGISIDGTTLSDKIKVYDPPYSTSTYVYDNIKENISDWIEKAIEIRNKY